MPSPTPQTDAASVQAPAHPAPTPERMHALALELQLQHERAQQLDIGAARERYVRAAIGAALWALVRDLAGSAAAAQVLAELQTLERCTANAVLVAEPALTAEADPADGVQIAREIAAYINDQRATIASRYPRNCAGTWQTNRRAVLATPLEVALENVVGELLGDEARRILAAAHDAPEPDGAAIATAMRDRLRSETRPGPAVVEPATAAQEA